MEYYYKVLDYLMFDIFGGPRYPMYYCVNLQKCLTVFFVFGLMIYYNNFSITSYVYAAIHGSYGIIWFLKHLVFPDPRWNRPATIFSLINSIVFVLFPYWFAAIIVVKNNVQAPNFLIFFCVFLYAVGLILMVGSDTQKYFVLKYKKKLIVDGFFGIVRNPNYLGEMMLYFSFALLSMHLVPFLILGCVWLGVFLPTMWRKEKSMSRYPEWKFYVKETPFLIPMMW